MMWVSSGVRNTFQQVVVAPYFIIYLLWRQPDNFSNRTNICVKMLIIFRKPLDCTRTYEHFSRNILCQPLYCYNTRRNDHFWPSPRLRLRPISSLLYKQCKIFSIIFTCKTGSEVSYCIFPETEQVFKKIGHISCNTWTVFQNTSNTLE